VGCHEVSGGESDQQAEFRSVMKYLTNELFPLLLVFSGIYFMVFPHGPLGGILLLLGASLHLRGRLS
jgi:hypothetical protein